MTRRPYDHFYPSVSLLLGLISLGVMGNLGLPRSAFGQPSYNCQQTIHRVHRHLTNRPNLTIDTAEKRAVGYADHPLGKPYEYIFSMRGSAIDSIFKSPQMLRQLTTQIINACDSISAVTYGRWGSGEAYSVGLLHNGQIDLFTCAEELGIYPGRRQGNRRLRWGVQFCSL